MNTAAEIRPYLALGTAAVRTPKYLKDNNITLVINATNKCPMSKKCCVRQVTLNCDDNPEYYLQKHFEDVAILIHQEKEKGGKTFVHCIAGISRSPTLILAYLMRYEKMTLEDAYNLVKDKRSFIRPNPGFWKQLVDYEKEICGANTVTMMYYREKLIPSVYQAEYSNMLTI